MADDSYANKSRWSALLPRKVRISNERKENGYIDNCLEVVCAEMLLRMKTAANRSFLAQKPRERQRTTHYPINGQSLRRLIATCIPHISFPPPGRLLVGEVEGSIEGVCVEGGG